jgi:pimeloyl-ACP methyl ester carboxylesterase
VLLHPSPLSARVLDPLITCLSKNYTAIALDRAGFGNADRLDLQQPEVADYAEAFGEELDALGIASCTLYGSATGAVVAVEFARRHPRRVQALILENLPLVTDDEAKFMLDNYAPAYRADVSGSHVAYVWTVAHDINVFWPWSRRELAARRDVDMPELGDVHEAAVDLFRTGPEGKQAYNAVWRNRPAQALSELSVPTTILCRDDSVMVDHLGRYPVNPFIEIVQTPRDPQFVELWFSSPERIKAMIDAAGPSGPEPKFGSAASLHDRITRSYIDVAGGQVCIRRVGKAGGRPLVMIPRAPESGRSLESMALALSESRRVIVVDLPGLGESDALLELKPSIRSYGTTIFEALQNAGVTEFDLFGEGTASLVALEMAICDSARVGHLILDGLPLFDAGARREMESNYRKCAELLVPRWDGAHLHAAWHFLRERSLYSPWYKRSRESIRWKEPLSAAELHVQFVDMIGRAGSLSAVYRAALHYNAQAQLATVRIPTMLSDADLELGFKSRSACGLRGLHFGACLRLEGALRSLPNARLDPRISLPTRQFKTLISLLDWICSP